jgi:N-hydroxyarylamine O-acetyltransferase
MRGDNMTAEDFDLDAYLRRLSYDGPREPSLTVLGAIVAGHAAAIPYENIDVLLKRGVRLDIASLQHKLVRAGRGGYCFEQNTLLEAALNALGFSVTPLVARVVRGLPDPAGAARNHKVLRVDLPEGPYLADVGFGNLTPTAPLALCPEQVQETPHEPFRLMPQGGQFMLQARLGEAWDSLFRFALEPAPAVDYEMGNWFTSTHPASPFLANLIVARPITGGRTTVFNRRFTIRDRDNRTTRRVLDGVGDYRDVLVGEFRLMLDDNELAAIAAAMAAHGADEQVHPAFA